MAMIRWLSAVSVVLTFYASTAAQSLDFEVYRSRVEPIFLKLREANGPGGSCFMCHTQVKTRFRLEPVSANISWTEEQSRRNYESVLKLVAPGDPSKSRLLLHPLAVAAGGDAVHAGGKHWQSQNDPEWQIIAGWIKAAPPLAAAATPVPALDFEAFKTRIQPIFLKKVEGLARCYACHSQGTNFRLQALAAGSTTWTEEQSRLNFTAIQRLVVPGDAHSSRLLTMPLAVEAGGDPFHPGGKHWASQDDPAWQTLATWVNGQR
jgi:hypothetical protein